MVTCTLGSLNGDYIEHIGTIMLIKQVGVQMILNSLKSVGLANEDQSSGVD